MTSAEQYAVLMRAAPLYGGGRGTQVGTVRGTTSGQTNENSEALETIRRFLREHRQSTQEQDT